MILGEEKEEEKCGVCKEKEVKYCCPACGAKTCSLACCKEHKRRNNCDGVRKTAPLKGLSELRDDYTLLTGAERLHFSAQKRRSEEEIPAQKRKCPQKQRKALADLALRKNIQLLLMPMGMSRQKLNASFVRDHTLIFWHLEVEVFKRCEDQTENKTFFLQKPLPETTLLRTIVQDHIKLDPSKWYLYLPKLPAPANAQTFYYLSDIDISLELALTDKCIIEFPKLYLAPFALPTVPTPILSPIPPSTQHPPINHSGTQNTHTASPLGLSTGGPASLASSFATTTSNATEILGDSS